MADNEENTTGRIQYGQNPNANEFFKSSSGYNSIDRLRAEDEESLKKIFSENNYSAYNGEELDGATTNFINTGYKITEGDNAGYLPVGEIATTETIEEDKENFKRKNSNISAIGDISEEKGLGSTNFDLTSSDFWASAGRTAITSLPGFSEVADTVNKFIPKTTDFDKSFGSLEEIKSNGNFKKEIPTYRGNLNNEHFYAGTLNSGYYGSLKGSSNLGSGILGVLENAANSLTGGLNIRSEVNFWKGNTTELSDEEILALQAVNFDNIYTSKPGVNIKNYAGGNFAAPFSPVGETYGENLGDEIEDIFKSRDATIGNYTQYENRKTIGDFNAIGCLYVEPFYNTNNFSVSSIPFQFNPEIEEGAIKANYEEEKILGRITSARYYINTDSDPVTLTTKYICTCDQDFKGSDAVPDDKTINFGKTHLDKNWHEYWTQNELIRIENAYRSLVFPLKDGNYMVRPPVVQIYIGNNTENPTVRNVLTYPLKMTKIGVLKESAESIKNNKYFEHSLSFNETNETNEKKGYFNVKRYIVTSVSIKDLENTNGWNYNVNKDIPGTKRGFTVTLSLSETTRNFLDLVPDFKAYYDAWNESVNNNNPLLLSPSYGKNKISYGGQDTNELSEDLEKLKNNKQSDLNDAKKQKKAQEKTLRGLTKDVKKNQQELDKINNDIAKLNTGDLDYMINNGFKFDENGSSATWKIEQMTKLKSAQISLSNKIQIDNNEMDRLNDSIGSLSSTIGGLKTNIRNISSAMKTLTLGAY